MMYNVRLNGFNANTAFSIENNCFASVNYSDYLDYQFAKILKKQNTNEISRESFDEVFAKNSNFYVSKQIANALANLKDTNGNQVDFNNLSSDEQALVILFLTGPFESYAHYGTRASISDVQIDLSQGFYVQANIHTIDGQVFSSAAKYAPKSAEYVEKYDTACSKIPLADFDRYYKISFSKAGNLSTDERVRLLDEIENSNLRDLDDFEGDIEITFYSYADFGASEKIYGGGFPLYTSTNIKLDINKASEALKNLPKDEELEFETVTKTFLDNFWDKFKAQIYEATLISKQKQELNYISGNNDNKKEQKPLSPLTFLLSNEEL